VSTDDPKLPSLPEVFSPDAIVPSVTPRAIEPQVLAEGLRQLQERIPGYVQLSLFEGRSMLRTASLPPEFIDAGIAAAKVWPQVKHLVGSSAEELRAEDEEIARWDEAERELAVVMKGIAGANRQRKHRLGSAILVLYTTLQHLVDHPETTYLRPYLEEMKRAYVKKRKKPRRKGEGE
jgi:hypothetical protein